VQQSRKDIPKTDEKKTVKKSITSGSAGSNNSKGSNPWSAPSMKKKVIPQATAPTRKPTGGIFAAMMADSDDSD
jgi:hypothetical protein